MPVLASRINTASAAYKENYAKMSAEVDKLAKLMADSRFQGQDKYLERVKAKGQLTARERMELCIDPGSPFLELLPLAGYGQKPIALGGTLISGIGLVGGVLTMVSANVGTIKGGSVDGVTLAKGARLNEIARENQLPVIYLVESAGANLPEQAKIFNYGGAAFREITRRSKQNIPSIAVVFGNSTAGGAYIPGMCDYSIFVKDQAKVFLAGPPLVKMATGEISDDESLGGALMHSTISGVADYMAQDDRDGIRIARGIMEHLRASRTPHTPPRPNFGQPKYDPDELLGVVSHDVRIPIDPKEVIARVVDGSDFTEFKPGFGTTLTCGWASICGYEVGILANSGVIFSDSANKGAQFIQLCNRSNTPLLFLQNVTGFMVGKKYEQEGIIKHGAKLINAVSNSSTPALTVMLGASYGAGNYAMCGRAYQPRFLFSYPNAKIAVMGPEQLAGTMEIVQREAARKAGIEFDENNAAIVKQMVMQQIEAESNAWYATGQLWDDGLIDPRETRNHLGFALAVMHQAGWKPGADFGVFRM